MRVDDTMAHEGPRRTTKEARSGSAAAGLKPAERGIPCHDFRAAPTHLIPSRYPPIAAIQQAEANTHRSDLCTLLRHAAALDLGRSAAGQGIAR